MKYGKILLPMAAIAACLLMGIAFGQDYLDGGYVGGSSGSDIGQYFTDPIFFSDPTGSTKTELGTNVLSLLRRGFLPGLRPALSVHAWHLSRTFWGISLQPGALLFRLQIELVSRAAVGAVPEELDRNCELSKDELIHESISEWSLDSAVRR